MPVHNSHSKTNKNTDPYIHIYNSVVEKRDLFHDDQDHKTFVNFLREYLTPPEKPEDLKVSFSVNGRVCKGVPHQPKNYFGKIELIAYSLQKDHFHLVVKEKVKGSLGKFMRSLCTRYVIYYNKKYHRSGSLFRGPYKSVMLDSLTQVLYLTRHLHRESFIKDRKNIDKHNSSYEAYLQPKGSSWINSNDVINEFASSGNNYYNGTKGYKNFVEDHKLQQKEIDLVNKIAIDPVKNTTSTLNKDSDNNVPASNEQNELKLPPTKTSQRTRMKMPQFVGISTLVFILLLTLGVRNVHTSTQKRLIATNQVASPAPAVSGAKSSQDQSETPSPTPETEKDDGKTDTNAPISDSEKSIKYLVIRIDDNSPKVNIRSGPSTTYEILAKANEGDVFELIGEDESQKWYQIKLEDGTKAYVWSEYADIGER
ncbi:SH3 domain-containing protein [Candidatus Woesebacteria bacterium]|nr:SH3 domain-containing protein [Candidatus Woesebacteria bacterium]